MDRKSILWMTLLLGGCGAAGATDQSTEQAAEPSVASTSEALTAASSDRDHGPSCPDDDDDDDHNDGAIRKAIKESCCGFPWKHGNKLGVGKFCLTDNQCKHNRAATICSSLENDVADHKSFYCTFPCDPKATHNVCGQGARCNCEELGCGCTPISCIEHPPAHCSGP